MNISDAIKARHSVRQYLNQPLKATTIETLSAEVARCNQEGELNIQLVIDEPKAFTGFMASYGRFSGARNYFVMVGKDTPDLEERIGYYGEQLVLRAQRLGLNTCWAGATYSKRKAHINVGPGEKFICLIALGYGATQGTPHASRPLKSFYKPKGDKPDWFIRGVDAAILAPTAANQQSFQFILEGENTVKAKNLGGMYSNLDLGIVKYHFEIGAGKENFVWG